MRGKTVIVTGANSGFGFETALALAGLGAHVVMACRDRGRGEQAREQIVEAQPDASLELLLVDLGDHGSITEFVSTFLSKHERLDVLINNAGVYLPDRERSPDGVELVFATNVLAYHALIRELEPVLRASAPARVINVGSDFAGDLDLDDLQFETRRYDGRRAYRQSKACDRMLTREWARRFEGSGVTVNAMAPGLVITGLYRHTGSALKMFMRLLARMFGRSVEEGADTMIWLASADEPAGRTGEFFDHREAKPCQFEDAAAERRLFEYCESLLA